MGQDRPGSIFSQLQGQVGDGTTGRPQVVFGFGPKPD